MIISIAIAVAIMSTMIITSPITIANLDTQNMDIYGCTTVGNNVGGHCLVDLDTAKKWYTCCYNNTNLQVRIYRLWKKMPMAGITLIQITVEWRSSK